MTRSSARCPPPKPARKAAASVKSASRVAAALTRQIRLGGIMSYIDEATEGMDHKEYVALLEELERRIEGLLESACEEG